jgi:hypothetical protein
VIAIALFPGDSALLLLLLMVGAFVGLGMISGCLRMAMMFVGTMVAYLLAPLLGPFVPRGFLPDNPFWRDMGVGSIHAFIVLMILFFIGIHFLHRWIKIKDRLKVHQHKEWGRVNSVIGLSLGGIMGVFYFLMIAGKITPLGYVTAQMQPVNPSADPVGYRLSARLYKDLHALGVDKAAKIFDPASPEYYAASDVAGLIYNNLGTDNLQHVYEFRTRLLSYPGLVDAAYNPHVMQLTHPHAENPFFMGLYSRTNITHLLANQTFQSAMTDSSLRRQLAQVNMDDLQEWLRNGDSSSQYNPDALDQHDRPRILGRWVLDVANTLQQFHAKYSTMDVRTRQNLDTYLKTIGDHMSLSFSDGNFYLEAKYFCSRALGRKSNNFIPTTPGISFKSTRQSLPVLQVYGGWKKENNSQYRTVFRWRRENPSTGQIEVVVECPALIWTGGEQKIILTLEGFNNEKYVFRRRKM